MKYIRVRESGNTRDIAKIILEDRVITIESKDDSKIVLLRELIGKWKLNYDMKDFEVFKEIPSITSNYSRLFFSNIITKEDW